jgi:MYXO-CTERM domain-containing protein
VKKIVLTALAVAALAGTAMAQQAEVRIVAHGGAVPAGSSGIVLANGAPSATVNLALQVRVTGSTSNQFISSWGGTIRAIGELDTYGTTVLRTMSGTSTTITVDSNGDPIAVPAPVGRAPNGNTTNGDDSRNGLLYSYRNLGINGTINPIPADGGTPNQEIFNIAARLQGDNLIRTTGVSPYTPWDPNTDTGATFGAPTNPPSAAVVDFFGGGSTNGGWVDVFRFGYTITDTTTARTTEFKLIPADFGITNQWVFTSGLWGVIDQLGQPGANTGFSITVEEVPAPGSAALLGLGGLIAARRRRTA